MRSWTAATAAVVDLLLRQQISLGSSNPAVIPAVADAVTVSVSSIATTV